MSELNKAPISDLFNVPNRFLRSVHLEKDFADPNALENYIVTPAMAEAVGRVADGLRSGSSHRAWRVTGDYGVGKSSFALLLSHLLSGSKNAKSINISDVIGWSDRHLEKDVYWPILITGAREGIVQSILRGVNEALASGGRHMPSVDLESLQHAISACKTARTTRPFDRLIALLREQAAASGLGVALIIDELGKLLEYAAQNPDEQDVYVLQRLAETAARSGEKPFLVIGLLHQGFQAYAERLPVATRHEWDKVAGRFDEIVFDQPLAHTAALISGALGLSTESLPAETLEEARDAARATGSMGWLGGATTSATTMDASRIYPLHPTLLPPLARFFARFGQNERSLFGFLLSGEPFALQSFSERANVGEAWYTIGEFYDYVRTNFGHRLTGQSYQSQWLRIANTIDALADRAPLELKIAKTVGLLNLLDADDLLPTRRAIHACLSTVPETEVDQAIEQLERDGVLFSRGERSGFRLWRNASVNLVAAFDNAKRALGPVEKVGLHLAPFLANDTLLARRHYLETGTMRYFEIRCAIADRLAETIAGPCNGDGIVTLVLPDTAEEQSAARELAKAATTNLENVVVGILRPLSFLAPELSTVRYWQWVQNNTPELLDDTTAAEEVSRQLHFAIRSLTSQLAMVSGLDRSSASMVEWYHRGAELALETTLTNTLSLLCDRLFTSAPRVANELINKNVLSSAAASARMRLIEGVFDAAERPLFGMDAVKAPPEKSIYLSIFKAGHLHVEADGNFQLAEPTPENDPLNLRPSLSRLMFMIRQGLGNRVSVNALLDDLKQAPYGVRDGLAPLLLALVLKIHSHELAVYENGTFLARFGALEFQRMTRATAAFEIQYCSVEGVRSDVFGQLAKAFANSVTDRQPVLLDVVQELCQFAARLPEQTRKSRGLSPVTRAVRDVLTTATEPATLLFHDLPRACGLEAFALDAPSSPEAAEQFVKLLGEAVNELQTAHGKLLERIVDRVAEASGFEPGSFDRTVLANRAARVSLLVREPRLRAFSLRLRDPGLSNDAWAEALASFVVARPPAKWMPGDEARFGEEIGALAELFKKVEAAAFSGSNGQAAPDAVRVNLTRPDGQDFVQVVDNITLTPTEMRVMEDLASMLPQGEHKRVQLLTNLLLRELKAKSDVASKEPETVGNQVKS